MHEQNAMRYPESEKILPYISAYKPETQSLCAEVRVKLCFVFFTYFNNILFLPEKVKKFFCIF